MVIKVPAAARPKFHATPPVASSRPPIIGEITEPRRTVNMVMAPACIRFSRPTSAGVAASSAVTPSEAKNPSQIPSR